MEAEAAAAAAEVGDRRVRSGARASNVLMFSLRVRESDRSKSPNDLASDYFLCIANRAQLACLAGIN